MSIQKIQIPTTGSVSYSAQDITQLQFDFDASGADFSRTGNDLSISFPGGSSVTVEGFFVAENVESLPSLKLGDGTEVSASDFLTAINADFNLETAAGPSASNASNPSGGSGEYDDASGDLLGGIDRLGSLGTDYWAGSTETSEIVVSNMDFFTASSDQPGGPGSLFNGGGGACNVNLTPNAGSYNLVIALDLSLSMLYPTSYSDDAGKNVKVVPSQSTYDPATMLGAGGTITHSDGSQITGCTVEGSRLFASQVALIEMLEAYASQAGEYAKVTVDLFTWSTAMKPLANGMGAKEAIELIRTMVDGYNIVGDSQTGYTAVTDGNTAWNTDNGMLGATNYDVALAQPVTDSIQDALQSDGETRFYFISDGQPNRTNYDNWNEFLNELKEAGTLDDFILHTVGINGIPSTAFDQINQNGSIGFHDAIPGGGDITSFVDALLNTVNAVRDGIQLPTTAAGVTEDGYACLQSIVSHGGGQELVLVPVDSNGIPQYDNTVWQDFAITAANKDGQQVEIGKISINADGQYVFTPDNDALQQLDTGTISKSFDLTFMDANGNTHVVENGFSFTLDVPERFHEAPELGDPMPGGELGHSLFYGTDDKDVLAIDGDSNDVYAGDGDDIIFLGTSNRLGDGGDDNFIYGGAGSDTIYSYGGTNNTFAWAEGDITEGAEDYISGFHLGKDVLKFDFADDLSELLGSGSLTVDSARGNTILMTVEHGGAEQTIELMVTGDMKIADFNGDHDALLNMLLTGNG